MVYFTGFSNISSYTSGYSTGFESAKSDPTVITQIVNAKVKVISKSFGNSESSTQTYTVATDVNQVLLTGIYHGSNTWDYKGYGTTGSISLEGGYESTKSSDSITVSKSGSTVTVRGNANIRISMAYIAN